MAKLDEHPSVKRVRAKKLPVVPSVPRQLDARWLRDLCLGAGAADVGFVSIDRPEADVDREDILKAFPRTRTLISIVCRGRVHAARSPMLSISNIETWRTISEVDQIAHRVVGLLEEEGIEAAATPMAYPFEMEREPGTKQWVVSHKYIAEGAGLGRIGLHRSVIHPELGSLIALGTVFVRAEVSEQAAPIDYNPCVDCKLCVAACPVGAIKPDGHFDFFACLTHNYQSKMPGFASILENVADSKDSREFREKVPVTEMWKRWQDFTVHYTYYAGYCTMVCPAGENVLAPFLEDRKRYLDEVVRPLQQRVEVVNVIPGSDAEDHVEKRFPHKNVRLVGSGATPISIDGFLRGLPLCFQRGQAGKLSAVYHLAFTGESSREATVKISGGKVEVSEGLNGKRDLLLQADSRTWIRFLNRQCGTVWPLLTRKIRVKGPLSLLVAFGKCFPTEGPR